MKLITAKMLPNSVHVVMKAMANAPMMSAKSAISAMIKSRLNRFSRVAMAVACAFCSR